jgi:8-oxo-dGTP diphosphatase
MRWHIVAIYAPQVALKGAFIMIRRFGGPAEAGQTYVRRPGAYALLPRGKQLLLTCQFAEEPDLQLPGGGIDPGESPLRALHREVLEETGWSISQPRRLGAFRRFVFMPEYDIWAEKICHIYLAKPTRRLGGPQEVDHQEVWLDIDLAAQQLGNAGDRYFAKKLLGGV